MTMRMPDRLSRSSASGVERRGRDAEVAHEQRAAKRERSAADDASHAEARARFERVRRRERDTPPARVPHDRLCERMLAAGVEARGELQQLGFAEAGGRNGRTERRTPLGERAGLVDEKRIHGARPVATMIDIGVARPSAQGRGRR
jgi:hypothetical protein